MNWDEYARRNPLGVESYKAEPVQQARIEKIAERCVGKVLDVGGGDGYATGVIHEAGHPVELVDISTVRVERAKQAGIPAKLGDAWTLPYDDNSFDTVVLAEILEHLDNPGYALSEACRVARKRVVVSLPLNGWADPTHQWRVSLDRVVDPEQRATDPTKGEQIVLTFQRGPCWPADYHKSDPTWGEQFDDHHRV